MREGRQHNLSLTAKAENPPPCRVIEKFPRNSSKHLPGSWNSIAVLKSLGISALIHLASEVQRLSSSPP
jgi:hypothetical protein